MSPRSRSDNFTPMERRLALSNNSHLLAQEFSDIADFQRTPHYICESCKFVSKSKSNFQVDHIYPVALGGTRNRVSQDSNRQLRDAQRIDATAAEIDRAIALLYTVGSNAAVLCTECNNRKSAHLFVPDDCGLAYTRHVDDLNPDHQRNGPPRPQRRPV